MKTRLFRAVLVSILALVGCSVPNATLISDGMEGAGSGADAEVDAPRAPAMLSGAPAAGTVFGDVVVGSSTSGVTYTITNDGEEPSGSIAVAFDDPGLGFTISADTCTGQMLGRHRSCTFDVKFTPVGPGLVSTACHVTSSPGAELSRMVSGNGLVPGAIDIVEASFDYGRLAVDAAPVTHVFDITNAGQVTIGMPAPAISGAVDSYFVTASTCTTNLTAGAHCAVTVKFDPSTVGDKAGGMTVMSNGGGQDVATLSGLAIAHVTATKAGTGTGTVQSSQTGLTCGTTCPNQSADFSSSPITLSATPDLDSTFTGWTGDCTGAGSCTLDLIGAKQVTAIFTAITPALKVTRTGNGTVTSDIAGIACGSACSHNYAFNAMVTLTAAPAVGSTFTGWGGACSGTGPCMVTMSAQQDVTAAFDSITPALSVRLAGPGSGSVTSPSGINCGTTCSQSYSFGTVVMLTATPNAGSAFTAWSGTGASSCTTAPTCALTMDQARDVTATFGTIVPVLTVNKAGTGAGTVTATPGTINCGTTCSASYTFNTAVTLTAAPAVGSSFTSWSGAGAGTCSTATTCVLTMDQSRTVTATFAAITPKLTTLVNGAGTGTVTANPAGVSCGAGCATYPYNQAVTLTAAAGGTSSFTGWSGVDAGSCAGTSTATCTVTMDQARTINATFDLQTPTLNVTMQGTGGGTVVSNPAGINCTTGTCSKTFVINTAVTLTPTASAGSTFTGWTGACTGTGTCTLTMSAGLSVFATFTALTPTLSVTLAGTGTGTITSAPAGISCSAGTCAHDFAYNQVVTLTAAATGGGTFVGWSGTGSGACNGTATATCVVTMDAARAVTGTFTAGPQQLTVTEAGTGTGTVTTTSLTCPGTCSVAYNFGTMLTLTATPTGGSTFTGWSGTGSGACNGTTGSCAVTMDQARAITASFAAGPQTLTVTTAGTGTGVVTSSPTGISCGATCSMTQPFNTVVTLTATPSGNDTFSGWSGAGSGACNGTATATCVVTLNAAKSVTATFAAGPRTITIVPAGLGTGTVTSSPAGLSCGATCTASFTYNTSVTLTATATGGSSFTSWSGPDAGACAGTATPTCVVTANQARTITATFAPGPQALTVNYAGTGSGTITSNPAGLSCSGAPCSGTFGYGQVVTLTATATGGSTFSGWSGGLCSGPGSCVVTMNGPQTVTATFVAGPQTLTVTKTGTGTAAGLVKTSDSTINCGAACSNTYVYNTVVTLTATPGSGDTFDGWGGVCSGTGSCVVTMTAARAVTATFTAGPRLLTVTPTPASGGGKVDSSPAGISACGNTGGTCAASFVNSTVVTLTATAAAGWTFSGWGGDCSGSATTCTLTMTIAHNVTATFNPILTVTVNGSGSVTGTGISCPGTTCTGTYTAGTSVTLTETPALNYHFTGWSGGGCSGTATTCTVTMGAPTSVTASFAIDTYTLAVALAGSGSGSVTSSPGGISCGGTCSQSLSYGSTVTLTASPATGSSFSGWSGGGCSGAGTCTVTVTSATSVTATFTLNTYTLSVGKNGTGSGTVSSSPGGINCGGTCSALYNHGTTVTLTASPATGSTFSGWTGGGCSGTGTCAVPLTSATSVTATFTLNTYTLSVTVDDGLAIAAVATALSLPSRVTSSPPGINCDVSGTGCTEVVSHGTVVTLTAVPATGSTFLGWSGGGCSGTGLCTVTVTSATSVTATFSAPAPTGPTLSVNRIGNGTVTSSPGGINCGTTCSAAFVQGSTVTLTADSDPGSSFAGWSTPCAGTGLCTVTMTSARSVTATFCSSTASSALPICASPPPSVGTRSTGRNGIQRPTR